MSQKARVVSREVGHRAACSRVNTFGLANMGDCDSLGVLGAALAISRSDIYKIATLFGGKVEQLLQYVHLSSVLATALNRISLIFV